MIRQSNALWPCNTVHADQNTTSDTHRSHEEAVNVTELLRSKGFGGDGKVFPLLAWVSEGGDASLPHEFAGVDNYRRPKTVYLNRLRTLNSDEFYHECYGVIYQAARCANNPRADWHWMASACYRESQHRELTAQEKCIYSRAWEKCSNDHS